ncbi:MAG: carbohydrate binding domain-containing protein [Deinococcales bacterium]
MRFILVAFVSLFVLSACTTTTPPTNTDLTINDFSESSLFSGTDTNGLGIGFVTWGDFGAGAAIALDLDNGTLKINETTGGWGVGFTNAFTSSSQDVWQSQDWSAYTGIRFKLKGSNSGGSIRMDLFDNRSTGSQVDDAERFFYNINDSSSDWQDVEIPFRSFARRTDWQPSGAPDDGLGLTEVYGYAFDFAGIAGNQTFYLDDIKLYK